MKTLFIDLASHSGLLACATEKQVVASDAIDHRIDDAVLLPHVEGVLSKAGWSYADLTQIACVIGPGGFTSLRVAVALTNALSHELNIPSCGIHLSDVYATRSAESTSSPLTWLHSTKKHELFLREFGANDQDAPETRCVTVDELRTILQKGMLWTGELIPEHRAMVDEAGVAELPLRPLEEVLPELLQKQEYTQQILMPWYGRGW